MKNFWESNGFKLFCAFLIELHGIDIENIQNYCIINKILRS